MIIATILITLLLLLLWDKYRTTNSPLPPPEDTPFYPEIEKVRVNEYRSFKKQYLQSPDWIVRKQLVIRRDHCCQLCQSTTDLNVHHISYKNLGNEPLSDLVLLCQLCHTKLHKQLGYPQTVEDYLTKSYPIKDLQ